MSSYLGYQHDERIMVYVIVDRDSNKKQDNENSLQQRDRRNYPVLNTNLRKVPMLGLERWSTR